MVKECHVRRGLAVIVGVKTYEPHALDTTADIDRKGLMDLFQHHYQYTTLCLDQDRVSREEFTDFLWKCRVHLHRHCDEYDVFIFAFSGHGHQDAIMLSDGEHYPRIDLLRYFNGMNCSRFSRKPKVFILDACKGAMATPRLCTRNERATEGVGPLGPDDNIVVLEANTTGYVAYEFAQSGGVMMRSFIKVMRSNEHRMTLDDMAKLVQIEMDRIGRSTETKQTMEYGQRGMVRNVVLWTPSAERNTAASSSVGGDRLGAGRLGAEEKKDGSLWNNVVRYVSFVIGGGRKRSRVASCREEVEVDGEPPLKRRRVK